MHPTLARTIVAIRGVYYLVTARAAHRSGLTTPCRGCDSADPHDAHLGWGSLDVLRSASR